MTKGQTTRLRILDVAQDAVLSKGFGATSIDEIIAAMGLTKSGFFYHFRDKNELAIALLERYVAEDERVYDDVFRRARELTDDPLQVLLLGLKLLSEVFANMPEGHPGCLVAAAVAAERSYDRRIQEIAKQASLTWRRRFTSMIEDVAALYRPREPIPSDQLADTISAMLEGGIVMSKTLKDPAILVQQTLVLRSMIRLLFSPMPAR